MYTYGEREDGDYLILDNNVPLSADEVVVRLRQFKERVRELETLWIEYLTGANLYSDGVEIPEELSGGLDVGLPFARKIYKALGGE